MVSAAQWSENCKMGRTDSGHGWGEKKKSLPEISETNERQFMALSERKPEKGTSSCLRRRQEQNACAWLKRNSGKAQNDATQEEIKGFQ